MFDDIHPASGFEDRQRTHDDKKFHPHHMQASCKSVQSKADEFARMCRAYETGERIHFNFESFGASAITRGVELLQNSGLVTQSLELRSSKVKHRSFDSFVVVVHHATTLLSARSASFRTSLSYCRHS